ncbi:MAG TPA: hypothetical protein VMS31_15885 [Pyrinomonadaceae bacterium]|nr:hypothetical protein [Pyrinomonadaceae bacterium]
MLLSPLTQEQRAAAIDKAGKVRRERAELKPKFVAMFINMALPDLFSAVQSDDVIGQMKVSEVLEGLLPGIYGGAVERIAGKLSIEPFDQVRDLRPIQLAALEREVSKNLRESAWFGQDGSTIDISLDTDTRDEFQIEVDWNDEENVRRALREAGAPLHEPYDALDVESTPQFVVIAIAASSGAWLCIRTAIKGLAERNRHKTFRLVLSDGTHLVADGYSIDQLARLVQLVSDQYVERLKEMENPQDLRQAIAQVTKKLLDHRRTWSADETVDFCLEQAVRLIDNPHSEGQEELPKWVALAVKRIRELNSSTDSAPAGSEDAKRVLDEATKLLTQIAAPPDASAKDSPREQRY